MNVARPNRCSKSTYSGVGSVVPSIVAARAIATSQNAAARDATGRRRAVTATGCPAEGRAFDSDWATSHLLGWGPAATQGASAGFTASLRNRASGVITATGRTGYRPPPVPATGCRRGRPAGRGPRPRPAGGGGPAPPPGRPARRPRRGRGPPPDTH